MTSSAAAGMLASVAVAIKALQLWVCAPTNWYMLSVIGTTELPVVRVSANRKSLQANRNEKTAAVTSELRLRGSTTDRKTRTSLAPSILAASRREAGMFAMNDRMSRMQN